MTDLKQRDTVALPGITREEWLRYQWLDFTTVGDLHRVLVRGTERTPAEAAQAAREWEVFDEIWNAQ